jgi:folate-binding Fe-S cluster repair protein YgfZ
LEYGFDELQAIDWKKGCYMGQELTARTRYRGLVRKRLLPVKIEGESPPPFTPIFLGDEEVGEMRTSVSGCGLALLRLASIRDSLPKLTCGNAQIMPYIPSWVQLPAAED